MCWIQFFCSVNVIKVQIHVADPNLSIFLVSSCHLVTTCFLATLPYLLNLVCHITFKMYGTVSNIGNGFIYSAS